MYEKYGIQKLREVLVSKRSKRYKGKKWKYVEDEEWVIPAEGKFLTVLLSKKLLKVNNLSIMLEEIEKAQIEKITEN